MRRLRLPSRPEWLITSSIVIPAWIKFTVLLLVAVWLPATSHAWLESVGFIHSAESGQLETNHEAANGRCQIECPDRSLAVPLSTAHLWLAIIVETAPSLPACSTPEAVMRYRSTAPPELARTWQFTERTAPPSRAPSLAV